MEHPENSKVVLTRLIQHLVKNHTLSNMSAGLPKQDDHTSFIGRGEDIYDAIANTCNVKASLVRELAGETSYEEFVFVDKQYLIGLLAECENKMLINAIVTDSRLEIPEQERVDFLQFEEGEDGFIAKTPMFHYEVWVLPKRSRAMITMNPDFSESQGIVVEITKSLNMNTDEAILACQEHYFDLLRSIAQQTKANK